MRARDYVVSAQIIGEKTWRIIGWELLPNLTPIVASSFLFTVLYGVGTYTALAFLGLVNTAHWSWGAIMFWAQSSSAEVSGFWWWYIPPGLAVALLGTSLALLNFGVDEFINPRLRAAGLSRRRAKRAGQALPPKRFILGLTPVVRASTARASAGPGGRGRRGGPVSGAAAGGPLIEVRGLNVDYGIGPGTVHAVIDADLTLASGTVMGLAGESGSGKSTLAYAMTRLLRAPGIITGGEVLLHGGRGDQPGAGTLDLLAADEHQLRELRWSRVAVVLQSAMHALNPVLTIGSQLTDVLRAHMHGMDRAARHERAGKLLEMVGIAR